MLFLDHTAATISENLAIDEALLDEAEAGGGPAVLRLWEPPGFAVVLGASCRWREAVHVEACRADGVPIARRSTGGGTVVVGPGALNVAVVLPIAAVPGGAAVDVAQKYVLERMARSIRTAGVPVEVLGSGDLALGRRKCAGSAQRRLRHHLLVHATILYDFPLDRIARYTTMPRRQPAYRGGRSHEEFVVNLGLLRPELVAAVLGAWLDPSRPVEEARCPRDRARRLEASKFADPGWVGRF